MARLRWGALPETLQHLAQRVDLLLGADLVYDGNDLQGLADTAAALLRPEGKLLLASPASRCAARWGSTVFSLHGPKGF